MAVRTTATSRLTMLDGQIREEVPDVVAEVDGALEIVESLLLLEQVAEIRLRVGEQPGDRLAIHGVRFLLQAAQLAASLEEVLVLVAAEERHDLGDDRRAGLELLHELHH